jgi:glutathione S-transferase
VNGCTAQAVTISGERQRALEGFNEETTMSEIILHHYGLSPFAEKVRTALGLKGLAWRSVDVAPMPPRPLLHALTGGYRRIPVLQIGADIYCDTQIILPALERLAPAPAPTLYPGGSAGLAQGLGFAWERAMWVPTIGVLSHYIGDQLPEAFIKDRKEGYLGFDMRKAAMAPDLPHHLQVVHAHYGWLKAALADGRPFLFGAAPGALDLACWQTTFLLRKNCPADVDGLLGLAPLVPWYERIAAIGHGSSTPMTAEEALAIARSARPAPLDGLRPDGDPAGLSAGTVVTVTPDDNARVAVRGTLVAASDAEVVIHRHDEQAGDVHVHFPRLGFDVVAA